VRAMILAAGLGTRLRPFTTATPKPLLPVANRPLLEYTFALLAEAGIGEVIVNAHHLADDLEDGLRRLDSSGVRVSLSRERKILGTAGGPKKAAPFLESGTFLLLNGDFLIDIDLKEVVDFHRRQGAAATMVLREEAGGAIHVDPAGRIRQFLQPERRASPEWTVTGFTGIHILEPEVLKLIHANTPWEINRQVYPEMIRRGWKVSGFLHRGYWREAGDPEGFLAAGIEVIGGRAGAIRPRPGSGDLNPPGKEHTPPLLVGKGAVIEGGVKLGPAVVIGPEVRIGRGAVIARAIILEGADVAPGERIERAIVSREGRISLETPSSSDIMKSGRLGS
jgi:mannose-1-phosphate guanylyltransferase